MSLWGEYLPMPDDHYFLHAAPVHDASTIGPFASRHGLQIHVLDASFFLWHYYDVGRPWSAYDCTN